MAKWEKNCNALQFPPRRVGDRTAWWADLGSFPCKAVSPPRPAHPQTWGPVGRSTHTPRGAAWVPGEDVTPRARLATLSHSNGDRAEEMSQPLVFVLRGLCGTCLAEVALFKNKCRVALWVHHHFKPQHSSPGLWFSPFAVFLGWNKSRLLLGEGRGKRARTNVVRLASELGKCWVIFQRGSGEYSPLTVLCPDEIQHRTSPTPTAADGK